MMKKRILVALALTAALFASPPRAIAQVALNQEELVEDIVAWVNDDVVVLSELKGQEQVAIQMLMQSQGVEPAKMAEEVERIKKETLTNLIWNRLLVQEAERMFDMNALKDDMLQRFMASRNIPNTVELDKMLKQYGMERDELAQRLLDTTVPDIVLDQQVMDNLSVTEEEAREYYDENLEDFTTVGSITFREIVLYEQDGKTARREEAQGITALARDGADFVALVKERSEAPSKAIDGKIGPVAPGDLVGSIADALVATEPGGVTSPVRTEQGWHILKLEERVEDAVASFESVRRQCEEAIRQEKYRPAFEAYVASLWEDATVEVRQEYLDRLEDPWKSRVVIR